MINSNLLNLIEIKKKELDDLKKVMCDIMKNHIFDISKEVIFSQYPDVQSFSWSQYTPFFNDGDTCYFSANIDYYVIVINEVSFYDLDEDDNHVKYKTVNGNINLNYDHKYDPYYDVSEMLNKIGEELLQEIYGDHAEITIHRENGITRIYCEHE